jgi:hypothetical protein
MNNIICINTFIKIKDTFLLLDTLNNCVNSHKYQILISIDSTNNMPYLDKNDWIIQNKILKKELIKYIALKKYNFKLINLIILNTNYGPYKACQTIINLGFKFSDYVIFLEDDCVVSKDFLLYHEYMYNHYVYKYPKTFAISGSLMYSPEKYDFPHSHIDKIYYANWIPSFEFGITYKIWKNFGYLRGLKPEGDIYFGQVCNNLDMHTFYPLIPRCYRNTYQADSYSKYYNQKTNQNFTTILSNQDTEYMYDILDINNYIKENI